MYKAKWTRDVQCVQQKQRMSQQAGQPAGAQLAYSTRGERPTTRQEHKRYTNSRIGRPRCCLGGRASSAPLDAQHRRLKDAHQLSPGQAHSHPAPARRPQQRLLQRGRKRLRAQQAQRVLPRRLPSSALGLAIRVGTPASPSAAAALWRVNADAPQYPELQPAPCGRGREVVVVRVVYSAGREAGGRACLERLFVEPAPLAGARPCRGWLANRLALTPPLRNVREQAAPQRFHSHPCAHTPGRVPCSRAFAKPRTPPLLPPPPPERLPLAPTAPPASWKMTSSASIATSRHCRHMVATSTTALGAPAGHGDSVSACPLCWQEDLLEGRRPSPAQPNFPSSLPSCPPGRRLLGVDDGEGSVHRQTLQSHAARQPQ